MQKAYLYLHLSGILGEFQISLIFLMIKMLYFLICGFV